MNSPTRLVRFALVLLLAAGGPLRALAADATPTAPSGKPSIFVCGDSTAKNNANGALGWGTPIADYFDPAKATIKNVGHAGKSSLTYYTGDWPGVLPQIKAGDYVLLVFGINDGTTPNIADDATDAQGRHNYTWYMSRMATDAGAKGAQVVLLTVTARDMWTNPKVKFKDATPSGPLPADYSPAEDKIERGTANGKYTQLTKELGAKLHLPVFDLTNYCADLFEKMGREKVMLNYVDHNHTKPAGADIVASAIVAGLKTVKNSPFVALLSDKGRAVEPAAAKYVADNLSEADVKTPPAK